MRIGILSGVGSALFLLAGCFGLRTQTHAFDLRSLPGKKNIIPLVIIGSGPAGLSAAVYGARGNIHTLVIDGPEPGGLLTKTTEVQNWPGRVSIQGPEIVSNLKMHAKQMGAHFLSDAVEKVDFSQWPFLITTIDGQQIYALAVIIATGGSPRKLKIKGEEEYWGRGVTSCAVCDAPFYVGKKVVVIGGGDSAAEEALHLAKFASEVTVFVRKDHMRAAKTMQMRLANNPKIKIIFNVEPKEIVGNDMGVTGVSLYNNTTNTTELFATDGVFLAIGHDPNTQIFKGQLPLEADGYITVQGRSQATAVEGVFAAGDVEDKVYRQARVAEGSGVRAALDAERFLKEIGFDDAAHKALVAADQIYRVPAALSGQETGALMQLKTPAEFDAYVKQENAGLVVIDFFADYCPSCMKMLPIFETVANEFAGRGVKFAKVDAQEAPALLKECLVHKVPCLMVYRDGILVARYHDTMERKELVAFVEQFLNEKE